MFQDYKLSNGARVILVPLKDVRSMTTLIMYPVGSRFESEKMQGVSHYIEHMMFKGTEKRKNTLTLTREIDRLGAHYNAFTGKEYTGYYIKTDVEYARVSLDILSDMLFHSRFDAKEMEREKGPIVEEIRMYRDNPIINIDNVFEETMFRTPLGREIAGTPEHVLAYTRPDVLAFRDKYYRAANMTIVIAGGIDDGVRGLVEEFFAHGKKQAATPLRFTPAEVYGSHRAARVRVDNKQTDQVQLMVGFPGFSYGDTRNSAATVMNTVLGGSMSSRLFIQIRERRGLAYMVRSGDENFRDTGYAYIRAGLEDKNINKALDIMRAETARMCEKGVSSRELADAKTHIRGGLTLSLEDSSSQANWYATRALFYDTLETPEEYLHKIEQVSGDAVRAVAKELFAWSRARLAIIGDVDDGKVKF